MDNLHELSKELHSFKQKSEDALRRDYPEKPVVHRIRDIFDSVVPFDMEFDKYSSSNLTFLSLAFTPPPPSPCNSGCFAGNCEYFTGITDTVLQLRYSYIPNTVTLFYNGVQLNNFTESAANQVTLNSISSVNDIIKVCYVYQTCEYNVECILGEEVYTIDDFNRVIGSGWGNASGGGTWVSDPGTGTYNIYVDSDEGRQELTSGGTANDMDLVHSWPFLSNLSWVEVLFWLNDHSGTGTGFVGFGDLGANTTLRVRSLDTTGDIGFVRTNSGSSQSQTITGDSAYLTNSFWVGIRLEIDGTMYVKHWSNNDSEPSSWTLITLSNSTLSISAIDWFIITGSTGDYGVDQILVRYCKSL